MKPFSSAFGNIKSKLSKMLQTISRQLAVGGKRLSEQCDSLHISALKSKELVFILVSAFIAITICSKSSPIFPLNDWGDANCFFTVGKSMLRGLVPYRDLYEQKGPLLYMLHALSALVSEASFLGMYFMEILACFIFLLYSFKTIRLYSANANILTIPIMCVFVYAAPCFCHGDSAEELCLPLFSFALYVGLKSILQNSSLSKTECLLIGITASCVLWIKFSMLGFYIGWICVPAVLLIKRKKIAELFSMVLLICVGVLIVSTPILIYFALNNALSDLWTAYFYNNIFYYSSVSAENGFLLSAFRNLVRGLGNMLAGNTVITLITVLSIAVLYYKKQRIDFWFILSAFAGTFLLAYIGGRSYQYYALVFSAFAPAGMVAGTTLLYGKLQKLKEKHPPLNARSSANRVCALCMVISLIVSGNTYLLRYKKSDMPQYKFAEIISSVENAKLLTYGFLDEGFYTAARAIPDCKYFCKLNIPLEDMVNTQEDYIKNGKADFIITRDSELSSEMYRRIEHASFFYEWEYRDYYLYEKQGKGAI